LMPMPSGIPPKRDDTDAPVALPDFLSVIAMQISWGWAVAESRESAYASECVSGFRLGLRLQRRWRWWVG
jgi:hypothetical protein